MRKIVAALLAAILLTGSLCSQPFKSYVAPGGGINIRFYKNIEFLGFVFFLGSRYMGESYENNETLTTTGFKKKDWYAYDLALYKEYKSFKRNKNLATGVRFAEAMQGSYLASFLIKLPDFPAASIPEELSPGLYLGFSDTYDTLEAKRNATLFIEALNEFYRETDFDSYFRSKDRMYEQALQEIKSKLPGSPFLPAMEKFYRQHFEQYSLLPSLTIPSGMAFSVSNKQHGKTEIINLFGPFALQQFDTGAILNMGFADEKHIRELSTHEFGHSFTNPVLDKIPAKLISETAFRFDTIKAAMNDQGYTTWKACLYEHFVRAGEVIISASLGNNKDAAKLKAEYIEKRKFIYLPLIIGELERYSKSKRISYEQAVIKILEKLNSN
jgi:hypothetical protein